MIRPLVLAVARKFTARVATKVAPAFTVPVMASSVSPATPSSAVSVSAAHPESAESDTRPTTKDPTANERSKEREGIVEQRMRVQCQARRGEITERTWVLTPYVHPPGGKEIQRPMVLDPRDRRTTRRVRSERAAS